MATLSLPKPVNSYAGEDELRKPNGIAADGNDTPNGTDGMDDDDPGLGGEYRPPRASDKYKKGIIYPPKEIRGTLSCSTLVRLISSRYHRQDRWAHLQISKPHHARREDSRAPED